MKRRCTLLICCCPNISRITMHFNLQVPDPKHSHEVHIFLHGKREEKNQNVTMTWSSLHKVLYFYFLISSLHAQWVSGSEHFITKSCISYTYVCKYKVNCINFLYLTTQTDDPYIKSYTKTSTNHKTIFLVGLLSIYDDKQHCD